MPKKGRSGNPAKRTPHGAEVKGSTTLELGCETCPARSEVVLAILGGLSLTTDPSPVPFVVKTHMVVEVPGCKPVKIENEVIKLDQEGCELPQGVACPDADLIGQIVTGVMTHPTALEWSLNPPTSHVRIVPPDSQG